MPTAWIALGGNLGDVETTFDIALRSLDAHPDLTVEVVSPIHRTTPIGDDAGAPFRNAAARITTRLSPRELLTELQQVETKLGRVRDVRWGPRTLDLDILLYDDELVDEPDLVIPHPALWYRRFVLDPLVDVAADVVHPVRHVTIGELQRRLLHRPLSLGVCGDGALRVANEFRDVPAEVQVGVSDGDGDHTLLAWLGSERIPFEELPSVSRLDASQVRDAVSFLRLVLQAALG